MAAQTTGTDVVATAALASLPVDEVAASPDVAPPPGSPSLADNHRRRRRGRPALLVCTGFLFVVVAAALLAPVLPIPSPTDVDPVAANQGISSAHLLGTDALGRDIFARLVFGGRVSLFVGVVSTALGLVVGGTMGLVAGAIRSTADAAISWIVNVLLAFPALIFALTIASFLGPSLGNVTIIIGALSVAPFARLVRGVTLAYSQLDFVVAARLMGFRRWRIVVRDIVPNVVAPVLSFATLSVGIAVAVEGGLSFLGVSVGAPTPSWGNMIAEGTNALRDQPGLALWPSLAMFLLILSTNVIGDDVRTRMDVRGGVL